MPLLRCCLSCSASQLANSIKGIVIILHCVFSAEHIKVYSVEPPMLLTRLGENVPQIREVIQQLVRTLELNASQLVWDTFIVNIANLA